MARFHLTIDFDDPLSESDGPVYAQLAASGAVHALRNTTISVEKVELVDDCAAVEGLGLTEAYREWCLRDEANEAPSDV